MTAEIERNEEDVALTNRDEAYAGDLRQLPAGRNSQATPEDPRTQQGGRVSSASASCRVRAASVYFARTPLLRHVSKKTTITITKTNKTNKTNKTKQNKTKQNKTKQNKTKQNKTKQNKTKQNKTNKQPVIDATVAAAAQRSATVTLGLGSLHQKPRVGGTLGGSLREGPMCGDRQFANTGSQFFYPLRQPSLACPADWFSSS